MSVQWFRRMGDIPGLDYEPPVAVNRSQLANSELVPEVHSHDIDGRLHESLWWRYPEHGKYGGTSSSPAHQFAFGEVAAELATATLLKRLWEGLELPGEPPDYHFAIQGVAGALWGRRRQEPEVLAWLEYLSWLDIRLIRAWPDAARNEYASADPGSAEFYSVPGFSRLIDIYSREGFLEEALGVARLASEFGQGEEAVVDLEGRLALLRAEDGY